jgi:hypothetical protein
MLLYAMVRMIRDTDGGVTLLEIEFNAHGNCCAVNL